MEKLHHLKYSIEQMSKSVKPFFKKK